MWRRFAWKDARYISALSVPTKLSIRHRDCISLKGWVSVLWYFVDDLLLLSIDAKRWKRLVRRGWWWYCTWVTWVPRDRWQAHQAAFSVSASDNQHDAHRKHEIWWGVKAECYGQGYHNGDVTFTSMLYPAVIHSWIDQLFLQYSNGSNSGQKSMFLGWPDPGNKILRMDFAVLTRNWFGCEEIAVVVSIRPLLTVNTIIK